MADFKVKNGLQAKRYLQTTTNVASSTSTVRIAITVANPGSGNKYYVDGSLVTSLTLYEGITYIFDQSDSTNSGHPFRFSATSDGTHNSGSEYTTGVTTGGTPGSSGAFTQIVVASGAPTLYTYCTAHSGMGFTVSTEAADVVDLSKGNNFSITPSGNSTFAFINPPESGKAQAFSMEITGGTNGMSDVFSTTLYTGNGTGGTTITNGIDLSGQGGLIWTKSRSSTYNHTLGDTVTGVNKYLYANMTADVDTSSAYYSAFNNNGYVIGDAGQATNANELNANTVTYVSWTFRKAPNFFDVVQITGDGTAGRNISHSLGEAPGMIIGKRADGDGEHWHVFHRSLDGGNQPATHALRLNGTNAEMDESSYWNDTEPTSTQFTVGNNQNHNGGTHIFYLFAHNNNSINCGSYAGNGSATGPTITTGFQPQWLMIKRATGGTGNWDIYDSTRGIPDGAGDLRLEANTTDAESTPGVDRVNVSSTGFSIATTNAELNSNGDTYVYVAIAASAAASLTWPTSVKYPGGTAPNSPTAGSKDLYTFVTVDGGTTYLGKKAAEGLS